MVQHWALTLSIRESSAHRAMLSEAASTAATGAVLGSGIAGAIPV